MIPLTSTLQARVARGASCASIARAQFLSLGIVQVYLAIFVVGGALLAFLCYRLQQSLRELVAVLD